MKKAIILTIFTSLCLFSISQDLNHFGNLSVSNETYIVALKQQSEASDDNLISEEIYNLTDNDRNSYSIIKIGNQFWMAENLKTTKFNDGTKIPVIYNNKVWGNLRSPGYCWYNNDPESYKSKFGVLYNGYTVSTGKLCPVGGHIPSTEEWMTLTNYCGEIIAGGKLKKIDNWMSPNTGATNATGFTALPGGSRGNLGSFIDIGIRGHWWSSTENDKSDVYNRSMSYSNSNVTGSYDHKQSGLSVRCVKDK
jgi:uncharacterized protein (TIGR02145 family)